MQRERERETEAQSHVMEKRRIYRYREEAEGSTKFLAALFCI
jgi:hypothetical protein